MSVSKQTLDVLKNFSQFSTSMLIDEPQVLKAISSNGIIGVYDTQETFPTPSAVYDVPSLLSAISVFQEPEVEFEHDFISIKKDKSKIKFYYADEEHIVNRPKESAKYKDYDDFQASFSMSDKQVAQAMKAAGAMRSEEMYVKMENGTGIITLRGQLTQNIFTMEIEGGSGDCDEILMVDSLNLYPGNYEIFVSDGKVVKFQNNNLPLFYFISVKRK